MILNLKSSWYKKPTVVEFYKSIHDLPITNYTDYQKLGAIEIGVGSTMEAFNAHFSTLHSYLTNNKNDEAIVEAQNMYRGYYQLINKVSVKSNLILPFIKTIDGKRFEVGDLDKCKADIAMLSDKGLTHGMLEDLILEVKKNLYQLLWQHFLPVSTSLPQ